MNEPVDPNPIKTSGKKIDPADHLANERTLLAWIRTSIGIMAFGFVVVKFSLFVKQFSLLIGREIVLPQGHHSSLIGILLVVLGAVVLFMSYLRYKKTEQFILNESYVPSSGLVLILTITVLMLSIALILYLIESAFAL